MLPEDAKEQKIGDDTYFVYAGTYYKPFYSGDDVVYMVSAMPAGAAPEEAPAPEGAPAAEKSATG
jgi:hypothetical protein